MTILYFHLVQCKSISRAEYMNTLSQVSTLARKFAITPLAKLCVRAVIMRSRCNNAACCVHAVLSLPRASVDTWNAQG